MQRPPVVRKASSLPGMPPKLGERGAAPGWAALARSHALQWLGLLVLLVILAASESWDPFQRSFYVGGPTSDLELWTYSYPLKPNHVPAWAVPCVAINVPIALVCAWLAAGRITRLEAHHAILVILYCVGLTGTLTNWVKCHVGRPRPHFVERCWHGLKPAFTPEGLPKCADDAIDPFEGIKSFPSGHTSWSTSGLGFATLFLLGKLRCFDGSAQPARFALSLLPLLGAVWIGLSRIQDFWHHVEDVAAGFCLGLLMAYSHYRMLYPPLMSPSSGVLLAAAAPPLRGGGGPGGSSNGRLASSSSRMQLLLQDEDGEYGGGADDKV